MGGVSGALRAGNWGLALAVLSRGLVREETDSGDGMKAGEWMEGTKGVVWQTAGTVCLEFLVCLICH